jgi:hypothetical protein
MKDQIFLTSEEVDDWKENLLHFLSCDVANDFALV